MNNRRGEPDDHSIPTNDAQDTNDAWDFVAKMRFPDEPVRAITNRDAWLIDHYRLSIDPHYLDRYRLSDMRSRGSFDPSKKFAPNELIPEVDRAYFRLSLQEAVNEWFERHGFDLAERTIPKHLFEAAVQAEFGQLPPEPAKPIEKGTAKANPRKRKPRKAKHPHMYKRFPKDDALVAEAVKGLNDEKFANVNQAAQAVAPRAEGTGTDQSKVRRLYKKIAGAYGVETSQNSSKQMK
ncbi:MAG: hypothetical protein WCD69_22995 [Xanthobacteraceae bacterium]